MTNARKIAQADGLIDFLQHNHGSDIHAVRSYLHNNFGPWPYEAHNLIAFIRNVYGDNAVICWYSYRQSAYVYGLAQSLQEGHVYCRTRTRQIRNSAVNVSNIVDRLLAEFPAAAEAERNALT